jgi:hypothetical protein
MKTSLSKQSFLFTIALLTLLLIALPSIGDKATVRAGDSNFRPQDVLLLADAGFAAGELKPLIGRWLRPDGGYILEIREAAPDGKLEAYYFNPRSINVHRAEASRVKSDLKLVVELRDAGYPGSTYALLYKPDQDVLAGYYFQAGRKQYFEVYFVRQK